MNVDIRLTREQHEMLLSRLGSEEAIREWLEGCMDQELRRLAAEENVDAVRPLDLGPSMKRC